MIDFDAIRIDFLKNGILMKTSAGSFERTKKAKNLDVSSFIKNENLSVGSFWYLILNPNKQLKCYICGKTLSFENAYVTKKGKGSERATYLACSRDEVYQNALRLRKQTNLKRYGVEALLQSKDKVEKCKNTWKNRTDDQKKDTTLKRQSTILKEYGSVNNFYKERDLKTRQTSIIKYGCEYPSQSEEVKNKAKQTCHIKYNCDYAAQVNEIRDKQKKTFAMHYGEKGDPRRTEFYERCRSSFLKSLDDFKKENDCIEIKPLIQKYGTGWLQAQIVSFIKYKSINFVKNSDIEKIKNYYKNSLPKGTSHIEKSLKDFIKSLNVEFVENNRKIISPMELDIYIPSKKLALELDGLFWHSMRSKEYHIEKTKLCKEKGIRLIHIFEDEWLYKTDIIKSIIKSALGIYDEKVYARKCKIVEIDNKQYKDFLEKNHSQGPINSSYRYGLFFNNQLIEVAGFGKNRFKKNEFELQRCCTKLNTQIVGGFSKLIKHFSHNFISYIDLAKFTGDSYLKIGFKKLQVTPPSYFYFYKDSAHKYHRINFQKHKLKNFPNYADNKTEEQIMYEAGYRRVYDCGTIKVGYYGNENKVD